MLILKRIKDSSAVAIHMRPRPTMLNTPFLKAFALALFVHLLAAGLFKVHTRLYQAETSTRKAFALASFEQNGKTKIDLEEKEFLPSFIQIQTKQPMLLADIEPEKCPPEIKNHLTDEAARFSLFFQENNPLPLFQVVVSGQLENAAIINKAAACRWLETFFENRKESFRISYHVQVEGKTGKIFFWDSPFDPPSQELSACLDNFLKTLTFATEKTTMVYTGNIELMCEGFYD